MLVAASLIAGFATPIGLVVLVRLARDPAVMGDRQITARLAAAGWAVAVIVGGLGVLYAVGAAAGKF
jgi:Mn2+/Fe2+ NRAMP family transporter